MMTDSLSSVTIAGLADIEPALRGAISVNSFLAVAVSYASVGIPQFFSTRPLCGFSEEKRATWRIICSGEREIVWGLDVLMMAIDLEKWGIGR